jgi:hypothetical protein
MTATVPAMTATVPAMTATVPAMMVAPTAIGAISSTAAGTISPTAAAGNASATTARAARDPSRTATTAASCSVACRLLDVRRRVLKLLTDLRRTQPLGLYAIRHGHRSQNEHRCRQNHNELSHTTLLLYLSIASMTTSPVGCSSRVCVRSILQLAPPPPPPRQ